MIDRKAIAVISTILSIGIFFHTGHSFQRNVHNNNQCAPLPIKLGLKDKNRYKLQRRGAGMHSQCIHVNLVLKPCSDTQYMVWTAYQESYRESYWRFVNDDNQLAFTFNSQRNNVGVQEDNHENAQKWIVETAEDGYGFRLASFIAPEHYLHAMQGRVTISKDCNTAQIWDAIPYE